MPIKYYNHEITYTLRHKRKISKWIEQVVLLHKKQVGNITFVFCSDKYILEINRQFLSHDYYTDVITFDNSSEDLLEGEVYISLDTVRTNAKYYDVKFEDEIRRVLIHSVFHLLGFNDSTDVEREIMTQQENLALDFFADTFLPK